MVLLVHKKKIENNLQDELRKDINESKNSNEKFPNEIEVTIIELIKEGIPYEGIRSQTEYEDESGNLRFPTRREVKKIRKNYLKNHK